MCRSDQPWLFLVPAVLLRCTASSAQEMGLQVYGTALLNLLVHHLPRRLRS